MRSLKELSVAALPQSSWAKLPHDVATHLVFPSVVRVDPDAALTLVNEATESLQVPLNAHLDLAAALSAAPALRRLVLAGRLEAVHAPLLPATLEALIVGDADALDDAACAALAQLPHLRVLSLRSSRKTPWSSASFASRHVESLCLRGCRVPRVAELLSCTCALRDVDLSGVADVTDAALAALFSRSGDSLVALAIEGCVRVTDASVRAMGQLPLLSFLSMADTPRIRHLDALPPSLQHLEMSYCTPPALERLPHLQELICNFHRSLDASYFSAGAVNALSLRTLGLVGCIALDDDAVECIAARCSATLSTCNLSRCPLLTDASVASLARCRALTELAIGDLVSVTDVSPLAACSALRVLIVGGLPIPDVAAVVRACGELEVLHAGSTLLTDAAVVALFESYSPPCLVRLDLSDCRLGADTARVIARSCHKLVSLNFEMTINPRERKEVS